VRPAAELAPGGDPNFLAPPLHDEIDMGTDLSRRGNGASGVGDRIVRQLFSADGVFYVGFDITVCNSSEAASDLVTSVIRQSSVSWAEGSYAVSGQLGAASFTHGGGPGGHDLMFRFGTACVIVRGGLSNVAARAQVKADFPPEAVEAIAETILLRLSRVASIAGKGGGSANVAVNGQTMPGRATLVGGQPKVVVADVAKLAGWKVAWDAKTGKVTLSRGGRTVNLAAGSMSATVGADAKRVALKSPVLKDAGQPVMDLAELVGLLGGKVVSKSADRVSVRI
jgi:hypothetical protein